ncbi:PIN domain-containing protein [Candidatus Roizmanbacteria bacterium]|nr:PIN domain-containing protein [Candidatus Roizmanbacteria bacterium]
MSSYFLDSDVIIDYLNNIEKSATFIDKIILESEVVCVSVITVAEVYSIPLNKTEKEKIERIFEKITIIVDDYNIAVLAGSYRQRTRRGLADCMIAASVKLKNSILVTRNKKDFGVLSIKIISPF